MRKVSFATSWMVMGIAASALVSTGCGGGWFHRGSAATPVFGAPNEPDVNPLQAPFPNLNASRRAMDRNAGDNPIALTAYNNPDDVIELPLPVEPAGDAQVTETVIEGDVTPPLVGPSLEGGEDCAPSAPAFAPLPPQYQGPGRHAAMEQEREAMRAMGIKKSWWKRKKENPKPDIGVNNPHFPRELRMASHPMYVAEPPDVLYIEAPNILPNRPLLGERLIRQDGTISLGYYGQVHVAGLTLLEVENKIRKHLSRYVEDPQVYVDVASFNSKVYYVLGQVQQQGRLPVTGRETVLDAVLLAGGLTNYAYIDKMHVARPNPGGGCDQVLWVDWRAIAFCGDTRTNYQLLPGDRVVVPATAGFKTSVMFDNYLSPIERLSYLFSLFRFALSSNNNNN